MEARYITSPPPYEYKATVVRVIDGDTVRLSVSKDFSQDIDFGFYMHERITITRSTELNFRLAGINAPEINTPEGPAAKAELTRLLSLGYIKAITSKPDKYGRWLTTLLVIGIADGKEINVNQYLLDHKFATPYKD
jgi:endonuclease YncB( thermonuclease family)